MSALSFILYRSDTGLRPNSDAVRTLMNTARRSNERFDLTGFLHHEDGFFFQWLEGEPDNLAEIMGRIERDPRHSNITCMAHGTQPERQFSRWRMGYSTRSDASVLRWMADHPVVVREPREYAAGMLAFLREREALAP
ncbi:BLUF domain-containing protein [Paracoccus sp. MC1862]|uniref:BLUF domain-containing protein n=1 Tax=Paracoccus sp. MC1862 TaxID=2760307 RepID=UPI001603D5D7|nr:BLUF domain-containing protein [Paracoccus sp. MC1862]MBB1496602.1 BLUF domain-containing protein [Paracoccus sp. MC1862]QQO43621.1 BLUF domain-containing protein [Paracoccus sp. MC1862]